MYLTPLNGLYFCEKEHDSSQLNFPRGWDITQSILHNLKSQVNFKATFSAVNKFSAARSGNSADWKLALKIIYTFIYCIDSTAVKSRRYEPTLQETETMRNLAGTVRKNTRIKGEQ